MQYVLRYATITSLAIQSRRWSAVSDPLPKSNGHSFYSTDRLLDNGLGGRGMLRFQMGIQVLLVVSIIL